MSSKDRSDKPQSIMMRFLRYKTKDDIIHKAWGKKRVLLNERPVYFDHDYPSAVLQKRRDYNEAKRVLSKKNIRFQTPFPAKLQVFYDDGTLLYQTAEEATIDMKDRGLPVNVTTLRESLADQLARTAWSTKGEVAQRERRVGQERSVRRKLQAFKRNISSLSGEP